MLKSVQLRGVRLAMSELRIWRYLQNAALTTAH